MASKKLWLGMLVMALAFGMSVVGCDNTTGSTGSGGGEPTFIGGIADMRLDEFNDFRAGFGFAPLELDTLYQTIDQPVSIQQINTMIGMFNQDESFSGLTESQLRTEANNFGIPNDLVNEIMDRLNSQGRVAAAMHIVSSNQPVGVFIARRQ